MVRSLQKDSVAGENFTALCLLNRYIRGKKLREVTLRSVTIRAPTWVTSSSVWQLFSTVGHAPCYFFSWSRWYFPWHCACQRIDCASHCKHFPSQEREEGQALTIPNITRICGPTMHITSILATKSTYYLLLICICNVVFSGRQTWRAQRIFSAATDIWLVCIRTATPYLISYLNKEK